MLLPPMRDVGRGGELDEAYDPHLTSRKGVVVLAATAVGPCIGARAKASRKVVGGADVLMLTVMREETVRSLHFLRIMDLIHGISDHKGWVTTMATHTGLIPISIDAISITSQDSPFVKGSARYVIEKQVRELL
ncbi:hypothetical protein BS78_K095400 [Paspalum vaginatum]|uniref:Uncharacterized protein n=1 Tax=Paspalum vaginatum TaxID=158149 RepID=A0A9W7X6U5_9POAL|nr:hypothetical protein BS78_K095400 [Paspalum vaginatum]